MGTLKYKAEFAELTKEQRGFWLSYRKEWMMPSKKKPQKDLQHPDMQEKVAGILSLLDQLYPAAKCSLAFSNPLELLVATVLSAQCTDQRVNQVTPELFKKYPRARDYARGALEELESDIRTTGFFHNKAKSIKAACQILDQQYGGQVPADLEALVQLPGIGRKTANVVLGNAYQIPGVVVDTHVGRVAQRLGLTAEKDPDKIERDLMVLLPQERWIIFSHQLIQHGRHLCQARKPKTEICPLRPYCDYASTPR
jgi:endonuclease III